MDIKIKYSGYNSDTMFKVCLKKIFKNIFFFNILYNSGIKLREYRLFKYIHQSQTEKSNKKNLRL